MVIKYIHFFNFKEMLKTAKLRLIKGAWRIGKAKMYLRIYKHIRNIIMCSTC